MAANARMETMNADSRWWGIWCGVALTGCLALAPLAAAAQDGYPAA